MKVFLRAGTVGDDHPQVIATYGDDIDIADDAHGPGVHVVSNLAPEALEHLPINNDAPAMGNPIPSLKKGWRALIRQTWTRDQKLSAVFEALTIVIDHGADKTKWPAAQRDRLVEIAKHFKGTP